MQALYVLFTRLEPSKISGSYPLGITAALAGDNPAFKKLFMDQLEGVTKKSPNCSNLYCHSKGIFVYFYTITKFKLLKNNKDLLP